MSEGHVYVCGWRTVKDQYEGWLDRWPKRGVAAPTFHEMRDALYDVVGEQVGDGEPQFEFEPPFIEAKGWEHLFRDGYRSTYFLNVIYLETYDDIFEGGFCDSCERPVGSRTSSPLMLCGNSSTRGMKSFGVIGGKGMRIPIASKSLLKMFTREEKASFEARPVDTTEGTSTFYEFVPRRFVAPEAGKHFKPEIWKCDNCGRKQVSNAKVLGWGADVVSKATIDPDAALWFLGTPSEFSLCFRRDRWEQVKDVVRSAQITSSLVAVIEPSDCV
jgi:hypothetical protein